MKLTTRSILLATIAFSVLSSQACELDSIDREVTIRTPLASDQRAEGEQQSPALSPIQQLVTNERRQRDENVAARLNDATTQWEIHLTTEPGKIYDIALKSDKGTYLVFFATAAEREAYLRIMQQMISGSSLHKATIANLIADSQTR